MRTGLPTASFQGTRFSRRWRGLSKGSRSTALTFTRFIGRSPARMWRRGGRRCWTSSSRGKFAGPESVIFMRTPWFLRSLLATFHRFNPNTASWTGVLNRASCNGVVKRTPGSSGTVPCTRAFSRERFLVSGIPACPRMTGESTRRVTRSRSTCRNPTWIIFWPLWMNSGRLQGSRATRWVNWQ